VLSGRGLCDELITRPEESYRLWCLFVCDLENLMHEEALSHCGIVAPRKHQVLISHHCYSEHCMCRVYCWIKPYVKNFSRL